MDKRKQAARAFMRNFEYYLLNGLSINMDGFFDGYNVEISMIMTKKRQRGKR